jgi:aminomethyltransferase
VCAYEAHSESEYFALRTSAGMLDVSPLHKLDLRGPDGARLLSRVFTRDVTRLREGRVTYGALVNEDGWILDDGTVLRLGKEHWRLSSSEPWGAWLLALRGPLNVVIEDTSRELAVLAVQGPNARRVLAASGDATLDRLRYFQTIQTRVGGVPVWVSRTGYTGDLGYEVWCAADDGVAVWDALEQGGEPYGLRPCGLNALDVTRIEAGFVLQGVDYVSARDAPTPWHRVSPVEAGLGFAVDTDRSVPLLGQERILDHLHHGGRRGLVGLEIDVEGYRALHERVSLPPTLGPVACRDPQPVYALGGQQVGHVTSTTWSPTLKSYIALATVDGDLTATGTAVGATTG